MTRKLIITLVFSSLFIGLFSQAIPMMDQFRSIENARKSVSALENGIEFNVNQEIYRHNDASVLKLKFPLPDGSNINVALEKADIYTDDFKLYLKSDQGKRHAHWIDLGEHYRGKIEGQDESVVAFSVFENEISGIISSSTTGLLNIGKMETISDGIYDHILYHADDFDNPPVHECHVAKAAENLSLPDLSKKSNRASCKVVRLYVEFDYYTYDSRFDGNLTATSNYANSLMNMSLTLFANDDIRAKVSEMVIWESFDGYPTSSSGEALRDFNTYIDPDFNGDIATLVSTAPEGNGGLAWVNVLCIRPRTNFGPCNYANTNARVRQVPTYSWDVMVVTHEIGHNLGSPHTHDCFWNGNGTRLDNCGPEYDERYATGNCGDGPLPGGGTIMSYCHLIRNIGIDFNLGFGDQPAELIRTRIDEANCLIEESLVNTSISAPTGRLCKGDTVDISVAAGFDYNWSTGQTTNLITISRSGTYRVTVTDANGCGEIYQQDVLFFQGPRNSLIYADTSACEGDSIIISTENSLQGTFWDWSNGSKDSTYVSQMTEEISISIKDSFGCETLLSLETFFKTKPLLSASITDTLGLCAYEFGQVLFSSDADTVILPIELEWLNDSVLVSPPGMYNILAEKDGCISELSYEIMDLGAPDLIFGDSFYVCVSDSLLLQYIDPSTLEYTYVWNAKDTGNAYYVFDGGPLTVEAINDNGCSSYDTAEVFLVEMPEILDFNFEYSNGDSLYLIYIDVEDVPFLDLSWTVLGGEIFPISEDSIYVKWNTQMDSAEVCVTMIRPVPTRCVYENICLTVPTQIISSSNEVLDAKVGVYPNPFDNFIEVKIVSETSESYLIEVFDVLGQKMYSSEINHEQDYNIDTENWASGSYFVRISLDGKSLSSKVLKL